MKQVLVIVEGQTEEQFVKNVLQPYLHYRGVHLEPKIVITKIVKGGNNFKGGLQNFQQLKRDISHCLRDTSVHVTTMVDFYALPNDFPGMDSPAFRGAATEKVRHLEEQLGLEIGSPRFIPYIQLHEFEALLFSSLKGISELFPDNQDFIAGVQTIIDRYENPEEINDNPQTAPSKRILNLFPGYEKPFHGAMIAMENGIEQILEKCPRFAAWVTQLSGLNF
ncbi:MAG: DUF4276 family protein [Bacteroidia bacterium]|nr:DUF4276 family protein [Bacteroidia bacterium]